MKSLLNLAAAVVFMLSAGLSHSQINPEKVYLVVNKSAADSHEVAKLYCSLRGVPETNIIEIDIRDVAKISRKEYFEKIENPLVKELVSRGAVKASPLGVQDEAGRDKYAFMSHDIDFIILCKGVPYGVNSTDPNKTQAGAPNSYSVASDASSVDSELAARFVNSKTLKGPLKNPVFGNISGKNLFSPYGIMRVARLDGAEYADVENSLKGAILAEKEGLRGRGYIDKSLREKTGDMWLESAGKIIRDMDFDVSVDEGRPLFGFEHRFDGIAIYFGWYRSIMCNYFIEDGFHFAPGAVGFHIYSFSAVDMRKRTNWTPGFVYLGSGMTVGNVYEPFLGATHRPDIMMQALAAGLSAGEAAYASIPVLSWQNIYVGDPMYSPFKVSLEEQLKRIDAGASDDYSQYVIVRMMNRINGVSGAKDAVEFGRKYLGKFQDYAILWKMFELDENAAAREECARTLFERRIWEVADFYGLAMQLADYFEKDGGDAQSAMEIYDSLLAYPKNDAFERFIVARAESLAKAKSLGLPSNAEIMKKKIAARDAELRAKKEAEKAAK